ncbi:Hsp70 family protein [Rhodococcus globerulus]|uniref:Hsp70 family protein n=1 Tax=Rhodococcus globerulus TaxID=33008 RepID=A0ABU4BQL3_RHOGO|nr:Hsp70 family protein [Rhodococcus globerulus]MDV6266517.1 Hsp70 family protein [Rhodococcus globerulus]
MEAGLGIGIGSTTLVAVVDKLDDAPASSRRTVRSDSVVQLDPSSVFTDFVERVGDPVPLFSADGTPHRGEDLTAVAITTLMRDALADHDQPSHVVIAHPAWWSRHAVSTLENALSTRMIHDTIAVNTTLVAEPIAVVDWLRTSGHPDSDGLTVVFDLGARSLDVTVVTTTGGNTTIVGKPLHSDDIGGDDFDHLVTMHLLAEFDRDTHIDTSMPETLDALTALRGHAREAKETLSFDTETVVHVDLPGGSHNLRLVRSELEDLLRPAITRSVALVHEAMRSAGVESNDVSHVVLAGGSSSIPLVAELLSSELRVPMIAAPDPRSCAAAGAATRATAIGNTATAIEHSQPKPIPVPAFSTPIVVTSDPEATSAARRSSRVGIVAAVVGACAILAAGGLGIGTAVDKIKPASSSADPSIESPTSAITSNPSAPSGSEPVADAAPSTGAAVAVTGSPTPGTRSVGVATTGAAGTGAPAAPVATDPPAAAQPNSDPTTAQQNVDSGSPFQIPQVPAFEVPELPVVVAPQFPDQLTLPTAIPRFPVG